MKKVGLEMAMYNLEQLNADGSHYVAIGFSAPYCLHLEDGNYGVEVESQGRAISLQLVIEKKRRNPNRGGLLPGLQEVEQFADRRGLYYFTSVLAYIPVRGETSDLHSDFEAMSDYVQANHPWANHQAIKAFNRLVEAYRLCTGECHIRPLAGRDVWMDYTVAFFFNESRPDAGRSKFRAYVTPVYSLHNIVPAAPDVPDAALREIRERLRTNAQVGLTDELLLNAHDFLDQGNYRLAVIEAETGFEAGLYSFLQQQFREKTRVKNHQSPIRLIKDHRFQAAMRTKKKTFNKDSKLYKIWFKNVWGVRNDIVHGKIADVSPDLAVAAVQIVERTLEYVLERPQTNPWRYLSQDVSP